MSEFLHELCLLRNLLQSGLAPNYLALEHRREGKANVSNNPKTRMFQYRRQKSKCHPINQVPFIPSVSGYYRFLVDVLLFISKVYETLEAIYQALISNLS